MKKKVHEINGHPIFKDEINFFLNKFLLLSKTNVLNKYI